MKTFSLLSVTLLAALCVQAQVGTNEPARNTSTAPLLAEAPTPLKMQQPLLLRKPKWPASPSIQVLKKSTDVSTVVSSKTNRPPAGVESEKAPVCKPRYEFVPMTTPELAERRAIFGFIIKRAKK